MTITQKEFSLPARRRGFHLVTKEVIDKLPDLPKTGLLHLFIKHTSAALSINENADPDVRTDLNAIFDRLVKEREPYYQHTLEGMTICRLTQSRHWWVQASQYQ